MSRHDQHHLRARITARPQVAGRSMSSNAAAVRLWRERVRRRPIPEHVHGTANGYTSYACRCRPCTDANARYWSKMARRRATQAAAIRGQAGEAGASAESLEHATPGPDTQSPTPTTKENTDGTET